MDANKSIRGTVGCQDRAVAVDRLHTQRKMRVGANKGKE
jgi:hypothetical protein